MNLGKIMPNPSGRRNYELNTEKIRRDLYRLATLVLADRPMSVEAHDTDDPLAKIRDQFVEEELLHLLISTAITNRIIGEHLGELRNDPAEMSFPPINQDCGALKKNLQSQVEELLSLREAANKIIHANEIESETQDIADGAFPILPNILTLRGELSSSHWEAKLDLVKYIRASANNLNYFM